MNDAAKKLYVLDTSVIIEDPDIFFKLGGNEIVVPTAVIRELDGLKRNPDELRAKAARQASRTLDRLGSYQDISVGAKTSVGSTIRICNQYEAIDDLESIADNKVVGTAISLQKEGAGPVILVSTDCNMRNVTRSYNIKTENYPFFLGDSVDLQKTRMTNEWSKWDEWDPAPPKTAPRRITMSQQKKLGSPRIRWVAAVALSIVLYYLLINI